MIAFAIRALKQGPNPAQTSTVLVERILGKAHASEDRGGGPLVEHLWAIWVRVTDPGPGLRHVFLIGLQKAGGLRT